MKIFKSLIIFIAMAPAAAMCQPFNYNWAVSGGGTGDEHVTGICKTPDNGLLVAGNFTGAFTINNTTYNSVIGGMDIFLIKYDQQQVVEWVKTIGNACLEHVEDVATDANGNIFLTGSFYSSLSLDNLTLTSAGSKDMFVIALNSEGATQWMQSFGGAGSDEGTSIAVSSLGSVYVAGSMYLSNLPGDDQSSTGVSAHLIKMNTAGNIIWSICESGDATGSITINDIVVDVFENSYVTGYYFGTAAAGDNGQVNLTASGNALWTGSYNESGNTRYIYSPAQTGFVDNSGTGITLSPSGNPVITGYVSGPVIFGSDSYNSADRDIAAFELDGTGNPVWSDVLLSGGFQQSNGIASGNSGTYALTGLFMDAFNTPLFQLANNGSTDAFLVTLKAGSFFNGTSFGTVLDDNAVTVIGSSDDFIVSGNFSGGGNAPLQAGGLTLPSSGDNDLFTLSVSENQALGMENEPVTGVLSAFPNPATDYVRLQAPFNSASVRVNVYSITGSLVKSYDETPLFNEGIRISVNDFPTGIYSVSVQDGKESFKGRFMVD